MLIVPGPGSYKIPNSLANYAPYTKGVSMDKYI